MEILIVVCIILVIALIAAVIKIVLLRRGYDELTDNIRDQVNCDTQIPVTLTTTDSHARRTAELLNKELANLQKERNQYIDGNRKVAEAVTGISHDIRTPLTAINSYLDLMVEEKDEELKAQYLERIKSRTYTALLLIPRDIPYRADQFHLNPSISAVFSKNAFSLSMPHLRIKESNLR